MRTLTCSIRKYLPKVSDQCLTGKIEQRSNCPDCLAAPDAAPTRPVSQVAPQVQDKMPKPKWHFGIRSRSPPMEVMLEIYKTLSLLGMQWKKKEGIEFPDIGPEPADGYPEEVSTVLEEYKAKNGSDYVMGRRAPPKKEIAGKEKAAQDLYLVKTRARYGTVMVSLPRSYKSAHGGTDS